MVHISRLLRAEKVLVVANPPIGRNVMRAERIQPHCLKDLILPLTPCEQ